MSSSHRPETDITLLKRYHVLHSATRLKTLTDLQRNKTIVTLFARDNDDYAFCSHLTAIDTQRGELRLEGPRPEAGATPPAGCLDLVAVALHARIKLQFPLRLKSTTPDPVTGELVAPLPDNLSRLQRREAYRVSLNSESATHLLLPRPQGSGTKQTRILDLSVTGLSFLLPDEFERPMVDQEYHGARIALSSPGGPAGAAVTTLNCDLVVRRISDMSGQEGSKRRIGCAILALSGSSERTLQVYLNAEQIRQRDRRKVLGD